MKKKQGLIFGGGSDVGKVLSQALSGHYDFRFLKKAEVNVADEGAVEKVIKEYDFDVVINCAGSLFESDILSSETCDWRSSINVNILGNYFICKHALRKKSDAKLVILSSTAAFNSYSNWSSYCIGKHAQVVTSFGLIDEGYNIACYCPGAVLTKFRKNTNQNNDNAMCVTEAIRPIVENLMAKDFSSGVFMYRKGSEVRTIINERI